MLSLYHLADGRRHVECDAHAQWFVTLLPPSAVNIHQQLHKIIYTVIKTISNAFEVSSKQTSSKMILFIIDLNTVWLTFYPFLLDLFLLVWFYVQKS